MPAINCLTNVSLGKHEFVLKINIYFLKLTNKKQAKTEKNIFICEGRSKINITKFFLLISKLYYRCGISGFRKRHSHLLLIEFY